MGPPYDAHSGLIGCVCGRPAVMLYITARVVHTSESHAGGKPGSVSDVFFRERRSRSGAGLGT